MTNTSRDKHAFVATKKKKEEKVFVATKIILVAGPAMTVDTRPAQSDSFVLVEHKVIINVVQVYVHTDADSID